MRRPGSKRGWAAVLVVAAVLAAAALVVRSRLLASSPQLLADSSQAEAFKYGSIGTEEAEGLPYHLWRILPRVFGRHLSGPGGYRNFGVLWEEGREVPVGFSLKTVGFPRIGINCALCHTGSYRTEAEGERHVVVGAPMTTFDAQSYLRFLATCAADPAFNADVLLAELAQDTELDWLDSQLYRHLIIPLTRRELLRLGERNEWAFAASWPRWGHGRIDPFNPVKYDERKLAMANDGSLGNSDAMPLWRLGDRDGAPLHWDGLNDSVREVFLSGALGDGATHSSLPLTHVDRLIAFFRTVEPPPYPWRAELPAAATAPPEFARCAACHVATKQSVVPIGEVRTDPERLGMWSAAAAQVYNGFDGPDWGFERFTKRDGYVAPPLAGLWLRAPYLHNGSVPTLEDLLAPSATAEQVQQLRLPAAGAASPAEVDAVLARSRELGVRPPLFFRGSDLYLERGSGFRHDSTVTRDRPFLHDCRVRGNANTGHEGEAYGTTLSAAQKRTLVAYLLTL